MEDIIGFRIHSFTVKIISPLENWYVYCKSNQGSDMYYLIKDDGTLSKPLKFNKDFTLNESERRSFRRYEKLDIEDTIKNLSNDDRLKMLNFLKKNIPSEFFTDYIKDFISIK